MSQSGPADGKASQKPGQELGRSAMGGHADLGGPVVLVLSPHAGRADGSDAASQALAEAGVVVGERLFVSDLDTTHSLGSRWRTRGMRAAVAAGGDGTVGAVVSHLDGSGLPLGILPMGTSNDTARSLGIPLDIAQAACVIAAGRTVPVDAGQAFPALAASPAPPDTLPTVSQVAAAEASAPPFGAYFLHALTLGFNVQFARLATDVARRERLRGLNYAASLLEALTSFRPVDVTLRFSDLVEPMDQGAQAVVRSRVLEVAVVNLPVFGGGMNLRMPEVEPLDQLLDFVVFETLDPGWLRAMIEDALSALARLPDAMVDRVTSKSQAQAPHSDEELGLVLPGVRRYKAREAVIESEQPLAVTLDGEVRAKTPVRVRVAPQPVQVFVPGDGQA